MLFKFKLKASGQFLENPKSTNGLKFQLQSLELQWMA